MEARARVTSKGQVTVPVEVRRELGITEGDVLVFELAAGYATVRKRRPTAEVVREVQERYLAGRAPREITNREAIAERFAHAEPSSGDVVYVSRGDGTFEGADPREDTDAAAPR
ncbi:MAG: AbrB/MazE/SpoVT family DNA-binding domain-containing protein [Actinobacteria bacterium]|nr:MAG: AbrB/MazE/SpoVT family DNA-binding domain-containing protein [Actinomycetota bacterium]